VNTQPTALDLFCGAGGLSAGLIRAGFNVLGAVDTWDPALRSYRANFPDHPVWQNDVSTLDRASLNRKNLPAEIDLVAGGPPCQGFSIQRIGADEDSRNDLVLAFGRVVIAARAKAFIMENVPGLLGTRGKALAAHFTRTMIAAGYDVRSTILNAADYGVPQIRRRVFFVGWRRDLQGAFVFPSSPCAGQHVSVIDVIGNLPPPPENFSAPLHDPLHRRIRLSDLNIRRLSLIPPGGGFEDLPVELRVNCHRGGASQIGHRAVYGRLHADRPAGTITGRFDSFTRGRFAHPLENRNITLREGARLQGFDDKHVFLGTQEEIAAQIGNAIPPPLAQTVALSVMRQLLRTDHTASRAA
jgi:DNA (cytosine-5)-methyltransferase 1